MLPPLLLLPTGTMPILAPRATALSHLSSLSAARDKSIITPRAHSFHFARSEMLSCTASSRAVATASRATSNSGARGVTSSKHSTGSCTRRPPSSPTNPPLPTPVFTALLPGTAPASGTVLLKAERSASAASDARASHPLQARSSAPKEANSSTNNVCGRGGARKRRRSALTAGTSSIEYRRKSPHSVSASTSRSRMRAAPEASGAAPRCGLPREGREAARGGGGGGSCAEGDSREGEGGGCRNGDGGEC